MKLFQNIKKIRGIKKEIDILIRAYMDDKTPVKTKLIISIISLVYIINPIDILPEFLPLIGIADDVMILPILMWVLLPNSVLHDARIHIEQKENNAPVKNHWILRSIFF